MTEGNGHLIDPNGDARRALNEAVAEHGPEALSNAVIMYNVCRDHLIGQPGESILIGSAARTDVPALLRDLIPRLGNYGAIQSAAATLAEEHELDTAACLWVVREFARALGHIAPGPATGGSGSFPGLGPRSGSGHAPRPVPGPAPVSGTGSDELTAQVGVVPAVPAESPASGPTEPPSAAAAAEGSAAEAEEPEGAGSESAGGAASAGASGEGGSAEGGSADGGSAEGGSADGGASPSAGPENGSAGSEASSSATAETDQAETDQAETDHAEGDAGPDEAVTSKIATRAGAAASSRIAAGGVAAGGVAAGGRAVSMSFASSGPEGGSPEARSPGGSSPGGSGPGGSGPGEGSPGESGSGGGGPWGGPPSGGTPWGGPGGGGAGSPGEPGLPPQGPPGGAGAPPLGGPPGRPPEGSRVFNRNTLGVAAAIALVAGYLGVAAVAHLSPFPAKTVAATSPQSPGTGTSTGTSASASPNGSPDASPDASPTSDYQILLTKIPSAVRDQNKCRNAGTEVGATAVSQCAKLHGLGAGTVIYYLFPSSAATAAGFSSFLKTEKFSKSRECTTSNKFTDFLTECESDFVSAKPNVKGSIAEYINTSNQPIIVSSDSRQNVMAVMIGTNDGDLLAYWNKLSWVVP